MKKLESVKLTSIMGGQAPGCNFFAGVACGASISAIIISAGTNPIAWFAAIGSCGNLAVQCNG